MNCTCCDRPLGQPLYHTPTHSINSLAEKVATPTTVYYCTACTHLQTEPMPDLDAYYAQHYNILNDSRDSDQIYAIEGNQIIYRLAYQAQLCAKFLSNLSGPQQILDYGAAKGATLAKLCELCPTLVPHVFEVSDVYQQHWQAFIPTAQQAIGHLPDHWAQYFDVVTLFFCLEHVPQPRTTLGQIHHSLKSGGAIYGIVPNPYQNIADLIVVDHINHFSEHSLRTLLQQTGFTDIEIEADSYQGGWCFSANKTEAQTKPYQASIQAKQSTHHAACHVRNYWQRIKQRVANFPTGAPNSTAIYGAGFYGSFIASCLPNLEAVACFVDRNQHLQQQTLYEKPIIAPEKLEATVSQILVGLNPSTAKRAIQALTCWQGKTLNYCYL